MQPSSTNDVTIENDATNEINNGYKKVQEIHKIVDTNDAIKSLTSFIAEGCNEFERKNGRKMTYSEMRAEYG